MEFEAFPKMSRLSRPCVITEKLDGTNAQVMIKQAVKLPDEHEDWPYLPEEKAVAYFYAADGSCWNIFAGSRTRWITPGDDNFGFAKWVVENAKELQKLGPGQHFGEWWGQGIQRNYGLKEKRFSLFNTARWEKDYWAMKKGHDNSFPRCCHVVPVLFEGIFDTEQVRVQLNNLSDHGSVAAPGFMKPEGVVIWHEHARILMKKTLENDEAGKGQ